MPRPVGPKGRPASRSRILVRRTLAVLLLLALDALVWGFMLQRLAARLNDQRGDPPGGAIISTGRQWEMNWILYCR